MKQTMRLSLLVALALGAGIASAGGTMDGMKGMEMDQPPAASMKSHRAVGVVKKLDTAAGTVTLAHEPVKSLEWPAMTMAFRVKDKALFDKLAEGKKIEFEFVKEARGYVVTAIK